MNPWFVRHFMYPIHERLLGRKTFARLRELEKSQWLDRNELLELQTRKLRALLVHAQKQCPDYEIRFREAELDPREVQTPADISCLPILTKAHIRERRDELTWARVPGGIHRYATGGSTGDPLVFYFDRNRQAYDQAARMRTHRWFGVDVGDPEVYLWGSPVEWSRRDALRTIRDNLKNDLLLNAFDMSATTMDQYLSRMERYNPVSLFGYPSSIALIVRQAVASGRSLSLPRLQAVFVTGETLDQEDRLLIEQFFGVPVANGYGSREAGFIAHQCPHGRFHLMDESVVVEILDEQDNPVAAGDVGRLIVTHLDAYAMPFIRYETGDMARKDDPSSRPCPCGRRLSTLRCIEGRRTDFLVSPNGTVRHALSAIYVLRELDALQQYRILQDEDCSLRVEVVCRGKMTAELRTSIETGLRRAVGSDLDIDVVPLTALPVVESGKHRPVISRAVVGSAQP